jgi:uncharacterized protein involved in exopolysaccharide biosynthesis
MLQQTPNAEPNRGHEEEADSGGLDVEKLRELIGFALRSARRRLVLVVATFVVVAAVGLLVSKLIPRMYTAQVKLLAQRSAPIRILTTQNPGVDSVENPTKNVVAMVMGQESLVSLAKDANLVERFQATRPRLLQWKDHLMTRLYGSASDEDKLLGMAYTLEKQLNVETDDMTVTISVDWTNPQIAYDLVTLVQKNFSDARYDSDVAVVNASIAVLEEHAKGELARVDEELKEYNKNVVERAKLARGTTTRGATARWLRAPVAGAAAAADDPIAPDPELTESLEEKRLRIRALEEAQQRTVESLRQELQKLQLSLTPLHPTVVVLQQQLEAASRPSAELLQLRNDTRALMTQIAPPRPALSRSPQPAISSLPFALAAPSASASATDDERLPLLKEELLAPLTLSESRLSLAMKGYQEALVRLDAARVELDIARTVYKQRYKVLSPAEVPRGPTKSSARLVAIGSVFGGALLGILLAAGLDLLGGAILESWQIRRRLKLDVLGELDRPS